MTVPVKPRPAAEEADAPAETVIGLFKAEVIRRGGPWRGPEAAGLATLERAHRSGHRGLLGPVGHLPPAEADTARRAPVDALSEAA